MEENHGNTPMFPNESSRERRLRAWKVLRSISRHRWLYLPRLFSGREKLILTGVALAAIASFVVVIVRGTIRFTVQAPATGGILREGTIQEPRFINPLYATSDTDRDLANLVFGRLVRYDHTGALIMDLAESVEIQNDSKEYIVRLRENAAWHDGEPFTANDVVFTIRTIQDPDYASPLRSNWQGVTVEKVDDATVRFTLRQPYAPFIENLSVGILPEHLWGKIPRDSAILSDLNLKPIGTGPYQFGKFTRTVDGTITSVVLDRNRDYHRAGPYLDEIHFSFFADEDKLAAAYRRNEIDSFVLLSKKTTDDIAALDVDVHPLALPKLFAVFLNPNTNPALGRKAVRQALASAIDRQAVIDKSVPSDAGLANSPIPRGTLGFNADIAPIPFDQDQAKLLLASDGWKANTAGALERSQGTGKAKTTQTLEIELVTSDAPDLVKAVNLIADMWRAIGVRIRVRTMIVNSLETEVIRPRNYEALLFGEVFGHDPDPFAFWHASQVKDPGLNIALYANPKVDQLLEGARREKDETGREIKYREFQEIVTGDTGAIFLYSPTHHYITRRTVRGVLVGSAAFTDERFNQINQWYTNTKRALK